MERIRKYNQILFSVVGTATLILLLVVGYKLLSELYDEPNYDDDTLIVRDELDSLKELNIRNQIISIEGIHVFDTASNTYVIPVYHKQLEEPTSRNNKVYSMLSVDFSPANGYYGYGNYNNLILYDFSASKTRLLLEKRMNIDRYNIYESRNRKLIVFTGWDMDTNKDGKLGEDDFKQAFVYDHNSALVKQVVNSDYRILDYEYLSHVDQLIFKVSEIKNDSVKNEERPEFLVSYSFEDNVLKPLVDMGTLNDLQEIIDN